jgi:hypothetical protein
MAKLAKATLVPLVRQRAATKTQPEAVVPKGKPVDVQFNPTSLRLQRQSNHDRGGLNVRAQRRQHASVQPATLSFDLEFDTAEDEEPNPNAGGRSTKLKDVRTRTELVRQFVEPPKEKPASAPPRVRFQWGSFIFDGLVTQITEELDYFDLDGTPLRAKVSVTITEQNLKYEGKRVGAGAADDRAASRPGAGLAPAPAPGGDETDRPAGGTPGRSGTNDVRSLVAATDGESVQQLAARVGGNPAAWRSLMNGLESPLALPAGVPVEVGSELEAGETVGRALGFAAGAGFSATQELAGVLGLSAAEGPVPTPSGPAAAGLPGVAGVAGAVEAAGFALAAAGGIASATTQVLAETAGRATASARASFAVPPSPAAADGELDPRALTYGRSLPLRARVDLETLADIEAGGRRSLAARARPAEVPVASQAGGAPWERLPSEAAGRSAANRAQRSRDARPSTIRWRPGGACR